jgi:hypothetical protein
MHNAIKNYWLIVKQFNNMPCQYYTPYLYKYICTNYTINAITMGPTHLRLYADMP